MHLYRASGTPLLPPKLMLCCASVFDGMFRALPDKADRSIHIICECRSAVPK